ncbi:FAD-binding oxidoreductase [Streptomyces sp. VRA16 Mangrove soil]|uniref:FAD-binding oxidoreductase n=1 Tax=Streptomyces sp. VRA16 Mangrove soil TaxID=2817434 RepID=UPI001A9E9BD5|nr:FAD-binding oxidoreductase [Streptomyces sp. VRA16 Mangrove soil]MBO1335719.1 oxidoreductase [Streptomyces sp. VRA16 Mangrove soil]
MTTPADRPDAAGGWRRARLTAREDQTATGRTLRFEVPGWPGHRPGQHLDVRLTADDGYQAVRSYSLAAPAAGDSVELGVQTAPDGEVSPYLNEVLPVGAEVEVKGPLGGWFVWTPQDRGPLLLIAGGCGVVPLMAMLRARRAAGTPDAPCALLCSVRAADELWYAKELADPNGAEDIRVLYTRQAPPGESRPAHRITPDDLVGLPTTPDTRCYVCGPTGFVEHAADLLQRLGLRPDAIRTERFG